MQNISNDLICNAYSSLYRETFNYKALKLSPFVWLPKVRKDKNLLFHA